MRQVDELARLVPGASVIGDGSVSVNGIEMDSRKVKPGNLFVCTPAIEGLLVDRHDYAPDAVAAGAAAIVVERPLATEVPMIVVKDARYAMAVFAAHLYGYPSRELKLIGITGTNGKTTTSCLLEAILSGSGYRTGQMGNLGTKIISETMNSDINTQEPPSLQRNLRAMADRSIQFCVMEASSQGIDMGRVLGCEFRTAVFTNLTQDHLDYHGSMERYMAAKGLLFSRLGNGFSADPAARKYAVLNADDAAEPYLRKQTAAAVVTYGIDKEADFRATDVVLTAEGSTFMLRSIVGSETFRLRLVGRFNVYNALAAITAAALEGIPLQEISRILDRIDDVNGRMEAVTEGQPFSVLVDYAHTPDGLESALTTLREFAAGNIIAVFGCGGNRDREKRPAMGKIAARLSDTVIITSDNPRHENPEQIMRDIERGLLQGGATSGRYALIADRGTAIREAIRAAKPGDIVLIAGKGHETEQIIGNESVAFDDREAARDAIRALTGGPDSK